MVCSYYSSYKWDESRGEERVRIHEGNRNQLEGKYSCSISEKPPFRSPLSPPAKFLIPLHAVPSYLQTCYKQCKVCVLEETIAWGAVIYLCYFWSKRQEKMAYYEGHIAWTTFKSSFLQLPRLEKWFILLAPPPPKKNQIPFSLMYISAQNQKGQIILPERTSLPVRFTIKWQWVFSWAVGVSSHSLLLFLYVSYLEAYFSLAV